MIDSVTRGYPKRIQILSINHVDVIIVTPTCRWNATAPRARAARNRRLAEKCIDRGKLSDTRSACEYLRGASPPVPSPPRGFYDWRQRITSGESVMHNTIFLAEMMRAGAGIPGSDVCDSVWTGIEIKVSREIPERCTCWRGRIMTLKQRRFST